MPAEGARVSTSSGRAVGQHDLPSEEHIRRNVSCIFGGQVQIRDYELIIPAGGPHA